MKPCHHVRTVGGTLLVDRTVRFIGGPLDGREQELHASEAVNGRVLRHIHLHEGPKIVTNYELRYTTSTGWQYQFRGPEQPS